MTPPANLSFDDALELRQQIDALIAELGDAEYAAVVEHGKATAAWAGDFPSDDETMWKEKARAINSARESLHAGRALLVGPALTVLTTGQLMHVHHYLMIGRRAIDETPTPAYRAETA